MADERIISMNRSEMSVKVIFAGFSQSMTEKLIERMSDKLKLKSVYSIILPEKYYREDKTVCHSYFTEAENGVKTGGYFLSGTADIIYAATDNDAVRNISWLKTEGTVIIANKYGIEETDPDAGVELREFLKKQEEYGFVRTFIH